MEAKRSQLNNNKQYQQNAYRVATRTSKTQAVKNGSDVSLTPSQAAEQAKLTGLKHPLDALSKPSKLMAMERRSGLQDVDEEYLKQNVFRKSLFSQNSGYNDGNVSQNQMVNQNAAGQPSIPPYEGYVSNNAQLNAQQNYQHPPMHSAPQQHQNAAAAQQHQLYQQYQQHQHQQHQQHQQHMQQLQHQHHHQQHQHQAHSSMPQQYHTHPSTPQQYQQPAGNPAGKQMQMQSQPQNPPEAMQQQQNQQVMNSKNQSPEAVQRDYNQKQHQQNIPSNQNAQPHGISNYNSGQVPANMYNKPIPSSEPDMCTTCPNCQTTIYLVRGGDVSHDIPQQGANIGQQPPAANVPITTAPPM